jgi:hypothetical protein
MSIWPGLHDCHPTVEFESLRAVLGWHYTNTPGDVKGQVSAILEGGWIGLSAGRLGSGRRNACQRWRSMTILPCTWRPA